MERAFDLTRYQEATSFNLHALENDTPALAVEGSDNKPVEKRVWRVVEALWNGRVVQRKTSKERDVFSFYADKTETQRKEKEAGRQMRQFLLEKPDGFAFVWVSPPGDEGEYSEGRIRIGIKKTKLGIPVVESFGVPVVGATPQDCLYQYVRLEEHAEQVFKNIQNSEDIRDKVQVFNTKGKGFSFLKDKIGENIVPASVWEAIETGKVAEENARAASLAKMVLGSQKRELEDAVRSGDERKFVLIGARIEKELVGLGFNIQKGTCGLLNTDLLKALSSPLTEKTLTFGIVEKNKWSYKPGFCRKAPSGCGCFKKEVGPCGICKDCEKKYS